MSDYMHILGDFLDGVTQRPYSGKRCQNVGNSQSITLPQDGHFHLV